MRKPKGHYIQNSIEIYKDLLHEKQQISKTNSRKLNIGRLKHKIVIISATAFTCVRLPHLQAEIRDEKTNLSRAQRMTEISFLMIENNIKEIRFIQVCKICP